ncbi:type IV pilus assembly protein FimV [Achromobacter insuavis]|uniref:type IV pilus assembly protein FimV n=1 Tax=Achromobacter insuavis TaxID=1287735 RepID=UPI000AC5A52E|nr:FimV/HubP family polar landmark protein [Achromobacter insuavis]
MTQRSRQVKHARRLKALQWAIALAIGASACSPALAMRVGHSRVVSAPGTPLQALVGLQELTPDEVSSLRVSVADEAAWQRAGLKPPAPLASLVVRVEDGLDPTRKNLRVRSTQAPASGAVDLLLDISSSSGQRQVQVSILVPLRGAGADVTPAAVGTPGRAGGTAGSVNVKSGDTLYAIAQRNAVPNASIYQMLVALWRANPEAFIQNNMNLVRSGQKLVIPDAATVRAVDPAEARRIFNEHAEAFARYRARIGAAAGANPSVVKGQDAASGTVTKPGDTGVASASQPQDRVRLSSGQAQGGAAAQADAQADQRTSNERAMADAEGRVNQLQSNVDELNKAVGGQGASGSGAAGASGATGAAGAAAAAGAADAAGAGDGRGRDIGHRAGHLRGIAVRRQREPGARGLVRRCGA